MLDRRGLGAENDAVVVRGGLGGRDAMLARVTGVSECLAWGFGRVDVVVGGSLLTASDVSAEVVNFLAGVPPRPRRRPPRRPLG